MAFFKKAGFEAVDVNFSATIYKDEFKHECILDGDYKKNLDEVMEATDKCGLKIAHTHAPFFRSNGIGSPDYTMFEEMMYRSIEASAYIRAKIYRNSSPKRRAR